MGLTVLAEADHKDTLPLETARMLPAPGHGARFISDTGPDIGQSAGLPGSLSRRWTSPRESAPLRGSALTPDDGRDHHAPGMVCQPAAADQGSALRHRPQMIFVSCTFRCVRRHPGAGKITPGGVHLDDGKHSHHRFETAVAALPSRIGLRIAVESPNGYSDAHNQQHIGK